MSFTALERETVISMNDEEPFARVYTAQRPVITKLRKNPSTRLLEEGRFGRSSWATFELPKQLVSFRNGPRKPTRTSGQGFRVSQPALEHAK